MTLLEREAILATAEVSGEVYSRLINLSGRRRFTSQRVVLFAVLAAEGRDGALETSREALAVFMAANQALTQGGDGLPGLFCPELREAHHGAGGAGKAIDDFIALARRTHQALADATRIAGGRVTQLVDAATPLLAALNAVTQVYEDLGRRHARQQREHLASMMGEIQQIARQARIVSFNAQVVAARAAEGGREFAVVAGELMRITSHMDELVREAVRSA
jgi:hypothetical protein